MSDKIFIRSTKFLDISQIKKINEASLQENYPKSYWDEKFHEGKTHSFVAICLNQIIGYIFCADSNIMSFAIIEQYRNKGIGKQLMHCCLNTFDIAVTLHVRISNENAIKLYRSAGFVEIDYTDRRVLSKLILLLIIIAIQKKMPIICNANQERNLLKNGK